MFNPQKLAALTCLIAGSLAVAGLPGAAHADATYYTFVSTNDTATGNSIAGQDGYLYLQFNPSDVTSAPTATVTITNLDLGGGTLEPGAPYNSVTGAVTGGLPPPLSISNTDPGGVNSILEGVNFGSDIAFDVTFSGDALNPSATTTDSSLFSLSLFDTSGNPLLTNQTTSGDLVDINILPGGSISTTAYPSPSGGPSEATVTFVPQAAPVPEPAPSVVLFTGVVTGLAFIVLRRKRLS